MQNKKKIRLLTACTVAGVFVLTLAVVTATSDKLTAYLPSRFLLAQEEGLPDEPGMNFAPDGNYQTPPREVLPPPPNSGGTFENYENNFENEVRESNDIDYKNEVWEDGGSGLGGGGSSDNSGGNNELRNYDESSGMHGTATIDQNSTDNQNNGGDNYDNQRGEENNNYQEYKQQDSAGKFAENKEQLLRELKNRSRDLNRFERQAGKNPALPPLISQIKSQLQAIENCANSGTSSNDSTNGCWDLFENLNPLFEQANLAEDAVYLQRELKDVERIETRELAQMEKEGVEIGSLRSELVKIRSLIEQMLTATDSETREDLRWEKQDLFDTFQQKMELSRRAKEFAQFNRECEENLKKEVERAKKELSQEGEQSSTIIAQLDGLVTTCHKIVAEFKTKAASGDFFDGWEIGDTLREQVWEKLQELTRSFHEGRKCEDIKRGVAELERGLTSEVPRILANMPADAKSKIETLTSKGKRILADAKAALNAEDCEKAGGILKSAEELQWQFEDIMDAVGFKENLIDYSGDYDEMYAEFGDTDFSVDKEKFKQFMKEKRFGVNEMDSMKKLSKDVLAEYVERNIDTEDRTLEFASAAGLENTKLQALIQAKNALLAEVEALRNQVSGLKQEIQKITAELTDYNFGIGAAKDEAKTLAGKLNTMSESEVVAEFQKIKAKAIAQKVADGIIGFPDADDTSENWFAAFAMKAKNEGLIKGNADGTLNPGGQLNYSEAAVAFGRIAGLNGQKSNSAVAGKLADWANEGVAALEQKGVNLDFMARANAGDPIKREEVAVLLNEVLKLENVPVNEAGFSDLGKADAREQQAIANVNAAGIMIGKGGTNEFGTGENLSRAALTKVLSLAAEQTDN